MKFVKKTIKNYRCELCRGNKKYRYFKSLNHWFYRHQKKFHKDQKVSLKKMENHKLKW